MLMRTSVRIDEDLMRELRKPAAAEWVSLTQFLNQLPRRGLVSKRPERGRLREAFARSVRLDRAWIKPSTSSPRLDRAFGSACRDSIPDRLFLSI